MDKLRPILKQRYWICFGLALIFVLVGWWNASGNLAAKTEERQKSVEASFEKAKQGVNDPNADWVAAGKKENEQDLAAYKTASLQLWKRQQGARDWPEQIRSEMKSIKYFGEVESRETRERWISIYADQIDGLLSIVQPFDNTNGQGLVLVDDSRITRQAYDKWKVNPPTSNEIWSNQEDIWLLKALLSSIAKTNDSATRITESQVREIKRLHLRGGDRNTKPPAPSGQAGGPMGGGNAMGSGNNARNVDDDDGPGGGMGGMAMGPAVAGIAGSAHPGSPFTGGSRGDILAEEFGGTGGPGGFGAMQGGGGGNARIMDVDDDRQFGGGPGGAAPKPAARYVDGADKDIGYKTRGFLLDVVIRDERLPDLLAKLTNSDFPVEIVRVEITPRSAGGGAMQGGGNMMSNVDDDDGGGGLRAAFGNGAGMQAAFGIPGGGVPGGGLLGGGGGGRRRGKDRDDSGSGARIPGGQPGGILSGIEAAKAAEALNAAMSDPLLIEVHIGGLLTLYMTPEETEMQAKTEESAAKEEAAAAPAADDADTLTAPEGSSEAAPASEAPASEAPASEAPASEAPASEAPASEAPASEVPASEAPASEVPATEAPATEVPASEVPATEVPATEVPATEPPAEAGALDIDPAESSDPVTTIDPPVGSAQ